MPYTQFSAKKGWVKKVGLTALTQKRKISSTKRRFCPLPLPIKLPITASSFPNNPLYSTFSPLPPSLLEQLVPQELANTQEILEESTDQRVLVLALYGALSARDVDTVHKLLAPDLEWWFHGPPSHQFMMRLLTGSSKSPTAIPFEFVPQSVAAFGSTVLVEGCDHSRSISWVHAWTVSDGVITQVREYFNTSLTVTRFANSGQSDSSSSSSINALHCPSVWESSVSDRVGKSVPGLVLAI